MNNGNIAVLIDGSAESGHARRFVQRAFSEIKGLGVKAARVFGTRSAGEMKLELPPEAGDVAPFADALRRQFSAAHDGHVIVLVHGARGKHRPDVATELMVARLLGSNRLAAVDFLQVGGGDQTPMREMVESIAAMPDLFAGGRHPPVWDFVPDPSAVPKKVKALATARGR